MCGALVGSAALVGNQTACAGLPRCARAAGPIRAGTNPTLGRTGGVPTQRMDARHGLARYRPLRRLSGPARRRRAGLDYHLAGLALLIDHGGGRSVVPANARPRMWLMTSPGEGEL